MGLFGKKEFNLSEKRNYLYNSTKLRNVTPKARRNHRKEVGYIVVFKTKDVKEFIKRLKEENINKTGKTLIIPMKEFDKLAGDDLI